MLKVIKYRKSLINVLGEFPLFAPSSAGAYKAKAPLTILGVNSIVPLLHLLTETVGGRDLNVKSTHELISSRLDLQEKASSLKEIFNKNGTEKPNPLYALYTHILEQPENVKHICEIGIGTNNSDVVSTMGRSGVPGASLRAFRDYCPNALIVGGDVDPRIMFKENRIQTIVVDQTDILGFQEALNSTTLEFDLLIDDGLHSPNANLASLIVGLSVIKRGGWIVIEDIPERGLIFWRLVANLLPESYQVSIFHSTSPGYIFTVQKL
jgi:hypothetical protein